MNQMEKKKPEDKSLETKEAALSVFASREAEKERKKATAGFLSALAVVTVLLMIAVFTAVRLNETVVTVSKLKNEIETLEKQKSDLESELEKKNDMVAFEQYALNELGMLKGNNSSTEDREDKIE